MKVQNKEGYYTKLVKPGERTQRVSSPGLTKLSAKHCFVLHLSVIFLLLHDSLHAGFHAIYLIWGACNTTENIEVLSTNEMLDFTSVCNKWVIAMR